MLNHMLLLRMQSYPANIKTCSGSMHKASTTINCMHLERPQLMKSVHSYYLDCCWRAHAVRHILGSLPNAAPALSAWAVHCTVSSPEDCVWQVDWKAEENRPVTPKQLGTQVYKDYAVKDVVDYIDWNPFFQVGVWHCSSLAAWHAYDLSFLLSRRNSAVGAR